MSIQNSISHNIWHIEVQKISNSFCQLGHLSVLINVSERLDLEVYCLLDRQILNKAFCDLPLAKIVSLVVQQLPHHRKQLLPKFKYLESLYYFEVLIDLDLIEIEGVLLPCKNSGIALKGTSPLHVLFNSSCNFKEVFIFSLPFGNN